MATNEYTPLRIIQTSEENAEKLLAGESIVNAEGEEIVFGGNDILVTPDDLEARVNEKLDGKVSKVTNKQPNYRFYGVEYNRTTTQLFNGYPGSTAAHWVAMYKNDGTLAVKTPQNATDAANKDYVDTTIVTSIAALPPAIISTTWAELKQTRDNAQLIPGHFYRITDYECTTVQPNTKSAGHRFDIIVQAIAANRLSESARADYHAGDTYFQSAADEIIGSEITSEQVETPLVEGEVEWLYSIYEDDTAETGEAYKNEIQENGKGRDVFVAFDFRENNQGVVVPVLYKTDMEIGDDGQPGYSWDDPDYQDCYYYVGEYSLDGMTYDRWRKIEDYADGGSPYTWDSTTKQYALTNKIVGEGLLIEVTFIYGALQEANLPAWELKYCLDNDDTRFSWADTATQYITNLESALSNGRSLVRQPSCDRFDTWGEESDAYHYAWGTPEDVADEDATNFIYSKTENISTGDIVWVRSESFEEVEVRNGGKGVIYYMKDEWNNEAPYDFKNILFVVDLGDKVEVADALGLTAYGEAAFYTFSYVEDNADHEILDSTTLPLSYTNDVGSRSQTANNIIKTVISHQYSSIEEERLILPNNIIANLSIQNENYGFQDIYFDYCTYNNIVVLSLGANNITIGRDIHDKNIIIDEIAPPSWENGKLIFESSSMKTIILD